MDVPGWSRRVRRRKIVAAVCGRPAVVHHTRGHKALAFCGTLPNRRSANVRNRRTFRSTWHRDVGHRTSMNNNSAYGRSQSRNPRSVARRPCAAAGHRWERGHQRHSDRKSGRRTFGALDGGASVGVIDGDAQVQSPYRGCAGFGVGDGRAQRGVAVSAATDRSPTAGCRFARACPLASGSAT